MYEKITSQKQPQMQPFYWILTFEFLVLGMLVSIALLLLPFILSFTLNSMYWLLLLILSPVAFWMFKASYKSLKRRIWENRHLDHFDLYEDRMTAVRWNLETLESSEVQIEWRKVNRLIYGLYFFQNYHAYKEAKFVEKVGNYALLPCIHLSYQDGMSTKTITIPFMSHYQSYAWLTEAQKRQIELAFTNQVYDPKEMKFSSDWLDAESIRTTDWPEHPQECSQQFDEFVYEIEEEAIEENDEDNEASIEEQKLNKKKQGKLGVFPLIILAVQLLVAIGLTKLAEGEQLSTPWTEDPWYAGGIIFIFCILFFMFTKELVWRHYFIYCISSFLILLLAALITDNPDHTLGSEMEATLMGVSMLMPVPALLPMFIFRKLNKNKMDTGGDTL